MRDQFLTRLASLRRFSEVCACDAASIGTMQAPYGAVSPHVQPTRNGRLRTILMAVLGAFAVIIVLCYAPHYGSVIMIARLSKATPATTSALDDSVNAPTVSFP